MLRKIAITAILFLLPALLFAAEPARKRAKKAAPSDRALAVAEKDRDSRRRVALVIGNSDYASSPLKNPVNDARAMASTLRRLGFEVEEKTNLGYIALNEAVEGFGNRMKSGGVGLFYYAGHGMQVQGNNYLVPVDAKINNENEVRYKAVDAGLVLAKMESAKSDVNIVVLDACRDNPFGRSFRSSSRGLANMEAPTGTIIAYATAPGKTAADGEGKNGVYTEALIQALETLGLKVEDVFKQVRKTVVERTAKAQVPWESSSLMGDFHFRSPASMTDLQPSPVQPQPVEPPRKQLPGKPVVESAPAPEAARGFTEPTTGMEFVPVPGGCFQMGDTFGDGDSDEKPVHEVCLSGFSIGKYEVSQGQWKRIMGSNPSHFSSCGDECPVEKVSWNDVQTFIRKLNNQTSMSFRLPTEAEWEYAARSGGRSEKYSGGNDVDAVAWHKGNSGGKTHPVGQKQSNGLGIHDMSGNVWEWVQDWYGRKYYSESPRSNPEGASSGFNRVLRGGCCNCQWGVRTADRDRYAPDIRGVSFGFRLVLPSAR